MRDVLGPGTVLGYCTNVHPGTTLEAVTANLERHAVAVRERLVSNGALGVGLWLPADAARALAGDHRASDDFRRRLDDLRLEAFTINGFPYGDFHAGPVKHRVYEPDWTTDERARYTTDLLGVALALGDEGRAVSISTLPIGWPRGAGDDERLAAAAERLRAWADGAAKWESSTGVLVHLDLEPEPGCLLSRSADLVAFYEEHLLPGANEDVVRRHVRVCHDVCHAAVMFETQADAIERYRAAGIAIGKVQLSNAVRARFDEGADLDRLARRVALADFGEDRYLHQTMVRIDGADEFHDDLPDALSAAGTRPRGEWRVHYHVPLHVSSFGPIETTQDDLVQCLALIREGAIDVAHVETETYAWGVLPEGLRARSLAEGIAHELGWVRDQETRA